MQPLKSLRNTYRRINRTKLPEATRTARQAKLGLGAKLGESLINILLRMAIREGIIHLYRDYIHDELVKLFLGG